MLEYKFCIVQIYLYGTSNSNFENKLIVKEMHSVCIWIIEILEFYNYQGSTMGQFQDLP